MKTRRLAAFFLAVLAAAALQAEEADTDEDDVPESTATVEDRIVVTANRLEKPTREVGSSVTVITAEQIEIGRKSSVAEILRSVPGVEVVRGGGPGQVTSVFIRGGNSSHTLVLIDGVRVNAPTTGAFDFANLAADQVERIEVVRGPQSTLYGSEAVAGVISIFSKAGAEGLQVSGLAEAGQLGSTRVRLGVSGGEERFDYAVTVSDERTDGVSSASERAGNRESDGYQNTLATARLGYGLAGSGFATAGRIDLSLRAFDSEVANDGFDFLVGPVDDLNRIQTRDGLTASLTVKQQLGRRWRQTLVAGWNEEELAGVDPDDTFANFTVESRSFELTSQSDLSVGEDDVLTVGFAYDERQGGSVGSFNEQVDVLSAFVQNAWSWNDRFHLTAGLRHDDHSQFGGESTYRLSSSWSLGSATRLHGTYGTGFRAPTLNDLFFPLFSNPDLRPETSEGYDFGIERSWSDDRWRLDVTFFDTDFADLIAFSFVTFRPQNTAEASSSGVEVTLAVRPGPRFQLAASHTFNDTEDSATGLQLARRPEHRSTLDLTFRPHPRFSGSASMIVASGRIDGDGSDLDDYQRLDLSLSYRWRGGVEPYLRVENLLDDDHEEVAGFTSPGSVAVVGLGLKY